MTPTPSLPTSLKLRRSKKAMEYEARGMENLVFEKHLSLSSCTHFKICYITPMSKVTIDKLAQMTQEQFSHIDEQLSEVKDELKSLKEGQEGLKMGQERILEVLLEIPSKKALERFQVKTEARLTSLEKKTGI